jgi:hypothetical protein
MEEAENPDAILRTSLVKAIELAVQESVMHTGTPDKLGVEIFSDLLLFGPIWIPIHNYKKAEETAEEVIRQFDRINQSGLEQRGNLLGAPFRVSVNTICAKELQEDIRRGNRPNQMLARGRQRKNPNTFTEHAFCDKGKIIINNIDQYCLFHACEMARINATIKDRTLFYKFRTDPVVQRSNVAKMMMAAGIPRGQAEYDLQTYLPQVQHHYDTIHPGLFRFYVF